MRKCVFVCVCVCVCVCVRGTDPQSFISSDPSRPSRSPHEREGKLRVVRRTHSRCDPPNHLHEVRRKQCHNVGMLHPAHARTWRACCFRCATDVVLLGTCWHVCRTSMRASEHVRAPHANPHHPAQEQPFGNSLRRPRMHAMCVCGGGVRVCSYIPGQHLNLLLQDCNQ